MYQHSNCEAQHMAKNSTSAITAKSCLSVGPSQAEDVIVEKLVLPVYPCPHHRCCVLFFFLASLLNAKRVLVTPQLLQLRRHSLCHKPCPATELLRLVLHHVLMNSLISWLRNQLGFTQIETIEKIPYSYHQYQNCMLHGKSWLANSGMGGFHSYKALSLV